LVLEIKEITKKDNKLQFLLEGADVSFANALRRIMTVEVPCMAIEEVFMAENTSPLFDEIISQRLGLIPLITDLDSYNLQEECSCQGLGCTQCQVAITLDRTAENEIEIINSSDLKSQDPKVIPINPNIPIAKLSKDQRIVLEAYARLGTGKEHSKWEPVTACYYKYLPKIDVDPQKINDCPKVVEACPRNIFKKEKGKIVLQNIEDCSLCKICEEICDPGVVKVGWYEDKLLFTIESSGVLEPERILSEGLKILENKANKFLDHLKGKSEVSE
jgi:DNA-directed RNA polymerase subunit D